MVIRNLTPDIAKLEALFQPYDRGDQPGIVVGVAHRGRPIFRRGFGLASMDLPIVLSPSMRLRIGSVSKHFTSLAIMLLGEQGKLLPQDSVRRHIPELADWAEPVTLAHLMSHTGGVRCSLDIHTAVSNVMSRPLPYEEQLKLLVSVRSVNFAPGSAWSYSNGGYVLLTEIIRRLSGTSYEEFVRDRIFLPAGMNDSTARPVDTDFLPNSASLHIPAKDGGYTRGVFGPHIGGEGSIVSTVDDMLRWLNNMSHPLVGSAATWEAMSSPVSLNNGKSTGYGYGLSRSNYRGLATLQHSGVVAGGLCQMIKVAEAELDLILITNTSAINAVMMGNKVLDELVEGLDPQPETVAGPFPTGDFFSPQTGRYFRLAEKDGVPQLDFTPAQMPLQRRADGSAWFQSNLFTGATFIPTDEGLDLIEFETPDHLVRIEAPAESEAAQIAGRYRADEIGATAVVSDSEPPKLTLAGAPGHREYQLAQRGPGFWALIGDEGAYYTVERDGEDLLLSSTRASRIRFHREHV